MGGFVGVQFGHGGVDALFEGLGGCECLVGEILTFELPPNGFDVVQFGRILGKP